MSGLTAPARRLSAFDWTFMQKNGTALVTGASSGIGYELARLLAQKGWDLVLVARNEDRLQRLNDDLAGSSGAVVRTIALDLCKPESPLDIFLKLDAENVEVDILVNDAGCGDAGTFAKCNWGAQEAMISLNIGALTHLTRLALEGMLARHRGRILNVASTAAFRPGPLMAVYSATKAYVLSFSEAIANELVGTGVTVTALCPGPTRTGFLDTSAVGRVQSGRFVNPSAASAVASFGYEAMMRGQTVAIHGARNRAITSIIQMLPRELQTGLVRRAREGARRAPDSAGGG